MKKKLIPEPLLNTIARQVGRAAGTIVRASKLAIPDGNAPAATKAGKSRKKSRPATSSRTAAKKKTAKSRPRKSRSKAATVRKKTS
jgi:hypothetical protein